MIMPVAERSSARERQARRSALRSPRAPLDDALGLLPPQPFHAEELAEEPVEAIDGHGQAAMTNLTEPQPAGHRGNDLPKAPGVPMQSIEHLVKLFRLLADDTRLRILFFLAHNRELHVRALCDLLHQSQPAVSHHLALMREADLIRVRRQGKHNFYRMTPGKGRQMLTTFFTAVPPGDVELDLNGLVLRYPRGEELASRT